MPLSTISSIVFAGVETFGKNAVICGRSKNVGMPIAMLLHSDGIGDTEAGRCLPVREFFRKFQHRPLSSLVGLR